MRAHKSLTNTKLTSSHPLHRLIHVDEHPQASSAAQITCTPHFVESCARKTTAEKTSESTHLFRLPSFSKTSLSSSFICATRSDASSFFRLSNAWRTMSRIGKTDVQNESAATYISHQAAHNVLVDDKKHAALQLEGSLVLFLLVRQDLVPEGCYGAPSVWSHPSATSFSERHKDERQCEC